MTEKILCPVCGQHSGGYNRISLNEAKKKFAEGKKVFD